MVPGVEWDVALTHIHEEPKHLAQAPRYLQIGQQMGSSDFGVVERLQLDLSKACELASGKLR